jgi:paraquat-inducible protein B
MVKRKVSPTLIGAFVVGGLALVAAAIIAIAGNEVFSRKERAVMYFNGSIYGLQVGAPVVFRGVRVGSVVAIDVVYDKDTDTYSIPVVAELERNVLRGLGGGRKNGAGGDSGPPLPALVERGLRAQLSMQSLLTGLLYVDLDLRSDQAASLRGTRMDAVEIPTSTTTIQNLKDQLDGMDFGRLADDLSAVAASARAITGGPEIKAALADLAQISGSVRRLSARMEQRLDPLANDTKRTLERMGAAADDVRATAQQFGQSSQRMSALMAPDSPLVQDLHRSAEEVARTAEALRQFASPDSALMHNAERALQDVSRASRALRELAELLERQPEAVIRGRPENK